MPIYDALFGDARIRHILVRHEAGAAHAAEDGTENGVVNLSLGDGNDQASGVALQGDKLIIVAGTTTATDGSKNIAVLRLTAE